MLEAYKLQGYFDESQVFELDHDLSLENPKSFLIDATLSTSKENKLLGKKVLKQQAHILKSNELLGLADYAKDLVNEAIFEMQEGEIRPLPLDCASSRACDFCPFKASCKIDEHPENIRYSKEKIEISQIIGEEQCDRRTGEGKRFNKF